MLLLRYYIILVHTFVYQNLVQQHQVAVLFIRTVFLMEKVKINLLHICQNN